MEYKKLMEKLDFNHIREMNDFVYKNKKHLKNEYIKGNIPSSDYFKITSLLSSQSRSPLWEASFIGKNGGKKIPSSKGKGDLYLNGKYYEHKISGVNAGNLLHMVQIRLWQNVDYIIQFIDDDFNVITFELTHNEMERELKLLKASAAHGTKKANLGNENIEYRASIDPDSDDFKRWINNYKTDKYK